MYGKRNLDLSAFESDNAVVDELKNSVGASAFHLYHDRFYGSLLMKIHTAAAYGGTKLIENTDYILSGVDAELSERTLSSVYIYSTIQVINPTYQSCDLYFSYQVAADLVDASDILENTTITASSDALDVRQVSTIFCNTTSGSITIGGLVGGVAGQTVYLIKMVAANDLIIEHAEGIADSQDIITPNELDITLDTRGGVTLKCDGTLWYVVSE